MPKAPVRKQTTTTTNNLPVIYGEVRILEYSTTSENGAIRAEDAKKLLKWETEKEYQERAARENGGKPEQYLFGDEYHCLNINKEKVRTWKNANNRPFDMKWCEELTDMILRGQWAGPLTIPGETVNGETIRISRYGRVLSGQHQLTALILAEERFQKAVATDNHELYPFWNGKSAPVLETVVITGLSEDERILRTIDYVKPRSASDMLYTMELYNQNSPAERKELTRILSAAIDLLWTRTATRGYRTHPEIVMFLERHKRLLKCVEHLFKVNTSIGESGSRKINKLHLSAGQSAALCYLMGCSATTGENSDVYRNENPPSEKGLDWSYWEKAGTFWSMLAESEEFVIVRQVLADLIDSRTDSDDNQGLGGLAKEKLAILAGAWALFKDHPDNAGSPFAESDMADDGALCLHYTDIDDKGFKLPEGKIKLVEIADFLGIDCPEVVQITSQAMPDPTPPTPEEIERLTQEAIARRQSR